MLLAVPLYYWTLGKHAASRQPRQATEQTPQADNHAGTQGRQPNQAPQADNPSRHTKQAPQADNHAVTPIYFKHPIGKESQFLCAFLTGQK